MRGWDEGWDEGLTGQPTGGRRACVRLPEYSIL